MIEKPPVVSAIICTRNRGSSIVATISSILEIDNIDFELVIVDQSTNDDTAQAVAPFESDPRIRLIRSNTAGLGIARNIGLGEVRSDIAAYTDDDCTVPRDWLDKIYKAFQTNDRIALVYTNVDAPPHDSSVGFIPIYQAAGVTTYTDIRQKREARGIGAGMAVRASLIREMGGFDEMLGAGGKFPAAEDWDISVRALIHGCFVYETDNVSVLHFGFRTYQEGKALSRRDCTGAGAAYSKPLRCGHPEFIGVIAHHLTKYALKQFVVDLAHLRKPRGLLRIVYFFRGFIEGLAQPIDKKTMCYKPISGRTA